MDIKWRQTSVRKAERRILRGTSGEGASQLCMAEFAHNGNAKNGTGAALERGKGLMRHR